jgi:hypothetical protein
MANVKCPQCNKERTVSKAMVSLITHSETPVWCRPCRSLGNKNRFKNKVYDTGLYQTRIYRIWSNMLTRCNNKNALYYSRYGGRGIRVCERWETFANFYEDMVAGYDHSLTLDRIDNTGNYSPENCRWATPREQAINRENTFLVRFNGKSQTITDWAREIGIKRSTLAQRIYSYKWPIERALTTKTI